MAIIKEDYILPLGRQLFIPKEGSVTSKDDLIIETEGDYILIEKPDCVIVKNDDCCRSIKMTIKTKD